MPNWSRRRGQLQAYLAGIIDGEGSFGIYFGGDSYIGRLTIRMRDPEAVGLLARLYPEGSFGRDSKGLWSIVFNQWHARTITREMIPFLVVKRGQAKILLSFLVHRARAHRSKAANGNVECSRCAALVDRIAQAKQGIKGVNSVNALLGHQLREYRAKREEVERDVRIISNLLEGVETRDRTRPSVEPMSAPEQDIVQAA